MLFWLFEGRLIHIERYDMQINVKLLVATSVIVSVVVLVSIVVAVIFVVIVVTAVVTVVTDVFNDILVKHFLHLSSLHGRNATALVTDFYFMQAHQISEITSFSC